LRDPLAHLGRRKIKFPHGPEERGDVSIQNLRGRGGHLVIRPHKYAAAVTVFRPSFPHKLAIAGADGVGMNAEAACELTRAWEAFARVQIPTEDG